MKINIIRTIMLKDNPRESSSVSKTYNTDFQPRIGEGIFSTAFERDEDVRVVEVQHSIESNELDVWVNIYEIDSQNRDDLKRIVDMYMLHGWNCPVYTF